MVHSLPALPYAFDALEPHIDARTMQIHHDKHHQAYVDNLNKALAGTEHENTTLEELMTNISAYPVAVRNNGGGHINHSMFWTIMGPGAAGTPVGNVADAITGAFGSFATFKEKVNAAGATRFGSGWAWLVKSGGKLDIMSTANQDSPVMEGKYPVMGVDVWEHAYYLKYQNRRPDYLAAWWSVVNWAEVESRFNAAK